VQQKGKKEKTTHTFASIDDQGQALKAITKSWLPPPIMILQFWKNLV